jgi:hypothetical protein
MDVLADLARLAENHQVAAIRQRLRKRYRDVVGVDPERRDELRAALERIKAGGGASVEDVVDLINRGHQENGSVRGLAGSAAFATGT